MNALSRREREQQQHRAHILDTAERMFAERGFIRVSMREIAHGAEFALGTIYRLFGGKRQLYEEMLDSKMREFVSLLSDEMASATTLRQKVERFVEVKLVFLSRNLDFSRVYSAESRGAPPHGQHAATQSFKRRYDLLFEKLVGLFEQGVSEGVFIPAHPRTLASALDGLTSALAFVWGERLPEAAPSAEIELANQLFLKGVLQQA